MRSPLLVSSLLAGLLFVPVAFGQAKVGTSRIGMPLDLKQDRGRYSPVPFEPGAVEALFKDQLSKARDLDIARSFLDQIKKNKDSVKLLSGLKLNPDDPKLLEAIKPLVKDLGIDKKLSDMSADELKELKGKLEALMPDGKLPTPIEEDGPAGSPTVPVPSGPDASEAGWLSEEKLGEMFRDWLEGLDQSKLGDFLKDSPAWQSMIGEFQSRLSGAGLEGTSGWKIDPAFLKESLQRIRSVPPPQMPAFRMPAFNLGKIGMPGIGGPSPPGSATSLSNATLVWLVLLAVGLGLFLLVFKVVRGRSLIPLKPVLGPWPVDPTKVTTRTELRLAFEYLALLNLGDDARTWNHRQVASGLGQGKPNGAEASIALASIYELARYTQGPERLAPAEIELARQNLSMLIAQGGIA